MAKTAVAKVIKGIVAIFNSSRVVDGSFCLSFISFLAKLYSGLRIALTLSRLRGIVSTKRHSCPTDGRRSGEISLSCLLRSVVARLAPQVFGKRALATGLLVKPMFRPAKAAVQSI